MKSVSCSKPPRWINRYIHPLVNSSEGTWIVRLCLGNATFFVTFGSSQRGILRKIGCVHLNAALCCAKKPFNSKPSFLPPPTSTNVVEPSSLLKKSQFFCFVFFFFCRNSYLFLKPPISRNLVRTRFRSWRCALVIHTKKKYCPPPIYLLTSPAHYCAKLFCLCSPVAHTVFHTPHLKCEPFFSLCVPQVELCL